jgi:LPXTG-motif cell wall-anchored protein
LIYINFTTTGATWPTKRISIRYEGTVNSTTVSAFTDFMTVASDGTQFLTAYVPSYTGLTAWTSMRAYCFNTDKQVPSDSIYYLARADAITATSGYTPNEFIMANPTTGVEGTDTVIATAKFNMSYWNTSDIASDKASIWSGYFLDKMDISCSASSIKTSLDYWWPTCASNYATLDSTVKAKFAAATGNATAAAKLATLYKGAARYNYIYTKYHATDTNITNFANRTNTGSYAAVVTPVVSDSSSTLALGGIAAVAALASGAYFFVRKKKSA